MGGNNALVIELGAMAPGATADEMMAAMSKVRTAFAAWEAEGQVESAQAYLLATGNRTQRSVLAVLDVTHEQLESLVMHKSWIELVIFCTATFQNFATHRAVDLARIDTPLE